MSFLRYGEIYPCGKGTISRPCPRPSRWMSFQLAIPGGLLSSRARVRFTSRRHSAAAAALMSTQLHRTVLCDCSGCLSPGVHRTGIGILPHGFCHLSFPFVSATRFSRSAPKPALSSCRLYTDCHRDRKQVSSRLFPKPMVNPGFGSTLRQ